MICVWCNCEFFLVFENVGDNGVIEVEVYSEQLEKL